MQLTHVNTVILGAALILVIAPITLRVGAPMLRGIVCCRHRVLDVALFVHTFPRTVTQIAREKHQMLNLFMQVPRLIRKRLAVRCKEVYRQCVLVDDVGDEAEEAGVLHTSRQVVWAVRGMLVYARVDCAAIHTHYLARKTSVPLEDSQSRTVLPVV